ncbi:uncharacterized protein LOC129223037 [Uloborus diversus]|uniref:uncharacterized protein LOC129223037 n=1 Tax=Uloborus diversus TaxID=327109 RepID=UPI00240A0346|nr:uncharacterized protein LOC129223037 [Uloborus diversus]
MELEKAADFGMEDTEAKKLRERAKASLTGIRNSLQSVLSKNDILIRLEKGEEAFKDFDKYDGLLPEKDSEIEEFTELYFDKRGDFELPRLNIPSFNGNYTDWLNFKDLYVSTVHGNESLSKVQKFQYLKGLLEEPAAIIKHIPVCENGYDEAWQKLLNRYDKKKQIVNSLLKTFIEQPNIIKVNGCNLRQLADTSDEFLNERCSSLEVCDEENNKKLVLKPDKVVKANLINNLKQMCPKCNGGHGLHNCMKFKLMDVESRRSFVYKSGLCFVCFKQHNAKNCTSNFLCRICKQKHNTLLHESSKNSLQVSSSSNKDSVEETGNSNLSVNTNEHSGSALLPTAVVKINDSSGQAQDCRILLDSGSMASFISESCLQRLNLKRKNARISINGIGGSKTDTTRGVVNLTIHSKTQEKAPKLNVQAFVLNKLTANLPSEQLDTSNLSYLKGIDLADPRFQ